MTGKPEIVERYWYSIDWDVESLWALDTPPRRQSLDALVWHLDVPVWPDPRGHPYRTTPREVLTDPILHQKEHARIAAADLKFPIEVFSHKGRLMILDGIHRLAKAYSAGAGGIMVRDVPEASVRRM